MNKAEQADKQEQNRLKEEYLQLLAAEVWTRDAEMIEYERKNISRIIKLENGDFLKIEKPRIETHFCFGYGLQCQTSYEEAQGRADHAAESVEYFKRENLKRFDEWEKAFRLGEVYTIPNYLKSPENTRLRTLSFLSLWQRETLSPEQMKNFSPVCAADVERIKEAYKTERKAFEKRLDTYLKRYGTSKLETWAYWADE